ncbi:unnamed protein product, partial [Meganyctiphanes norvegica]
AVFWTGMICLLIAASIYVLTTTTITGRSISSLSSKVGYEHLGGAEETAYPEVDILLLLLEKAFSQYNVPRVYECRRRVVCEAHSKQSGIKPQAAKDLQHALRFVTPDTMKTSEAVTYDLLGLRDAADYGITHNECQQYVHQCSDTNLNKSKI